MKLNKTKDIKIISLFGFYLDRAQYQRLAGVVIFLLIIFTFAPIVFNGSGFRRHLIERYSNTNKSIDIPEPSSIAISQENANLIILPEGDLETQNNTKNSKTGAKITPTPKISPIKSSNLKSRNKTSNKATKKSGWIVQLATFDNENNAKNFYDRLKKNRVRNVHITRKKNKTRVFVTTSTLNDARKIKSKLDRSYSVASVITKNTN